MREGEGGWGRVRDVLEGRGGLVGRTPPPPMVPPTPAPKAPQKILPPTVEGEEAVGRGSEVERKGGPVAGGGGGPPLVVSRSHTSRGRVGEGGFGCGFGG